MYKKSLVVTLITFGLFLSGCGGGGGSSSGSIISTGTTTKSVSGNVIDPAVEGASISLVCGDKTYTSSTKTDEDGKFTIKGIPSSENLFYCTIEAEGGSDGDDLSGLILKTPYSLFNSNDGIFVTPLTTLLSKHDDFSSNIENAKKEVADFLGIEVEDLIKNPLSSLALAKKTKKITKVALSRDTNGNLIGYLDVDSSDVTQNSFEDFIGVDLVSRLSNEERDELNEELKLVDDSSSIDEIIKNTITGSVLYRLKNAFGQESYNSIIETNLEYLANQIVEEVKSLENKYKLVSKYQIRKILFDLGLTPSFKDDSTLIDSINTTLNLSSSDFANYYNNKVIDISSIDGIKIFDSKITKSILGNDNAKRVEYYTFSDKSHISKAIELIENTYDDALLNPSYVQIARGFAILGYSNEAIDILNNNIFGQLEKINGHTYVASILLEQDKNDDAKILLDRSFNLMQKYLDSKGAKFVESDDIYAVLDLYLTYFSAGYDKSVANVIDAQDVIDYFNNEIVLKVDNMTAYGRITYQFRNIIQDYIDKNEILKARKMFEQAANYVISIPYDSSNVRSLISMLTSIAKLGPILKNTAQSTAILNRAYSIDDNLGTNYTKITAAGEPFSQYYAEYGATIAGIRALNGELEEMLNIFETKGMKYYTKSTSLRDHEDTALVDGLVTALFLEGSNESKQKAIDLIYEYRPFKDFEGDPYNLGNQIYRYYSRTEISRSAFSPARQLKAYDNDLMVDFFEMLVNDMETRPWTLTDKSISKYVLNEDYGLTAVIRQYDSINNTVKRDEMLEKAINLANSMSDEVYKLNAYQAIVGVVDDLNLPKTTLITSLVNSLGELVSGVQLDSNDDDYINKLRNIVAQSKYLALYGNLTEARKLIEKGINSLPSITSGDVDSIEYKMRRAIGYYDDGQSAQFVSDSILSALIQTKDFKKAEDLIDEISNNISTLGESLDAYSFYRNVARAYASINNLDKVKITLEKIKLIKEKTQGTLFSVTYLSNFDAFNNTSIAFVDTDMDGKPDFFLPSATQSKIDSSGLILDDDIDGDGIYDDIDELPYYVND